MVNLLRKHWPIELIGENPNQGKITSYFGPRPNPLTGESEKHTGFDLSCVVGTPLICPENSTMIGCFMMPDGLYGNHVVIKTDSGYKWQAWHLDGFVDNLPDGHGYTKRLNGMRVLAGQVLGLTGNTGKFTTGPHTHIRVAKYPDTHIAVDPLEYYGLYECFSAIDRPAMVAEKLNELKLRIIQDCDSLKRLFLTV